MFLDVKQMKAKDERANQWSHCIAKTSSVCSGAVTGVFVHENTFNIACFPGRKRRPTRRDSVRS